MKNIHGGMLLLVKLQASACNFTKKYHSSMGFFHVFKIVQMVPNRAKRLISYQAMHKKSTRVK